MLCTQCGNKPRYRNGELQECSHDLSHIDGIDWVEFKASCIAAISVGKRCHTCETYKSLTGFYKNASQSDGRAKECASCSRKRARNRQKRPEVKAKRRKWRKSEAGRSMVKRSLNDPDTKLKKAAHKAVKRAIESGRLVRPEHCEECPSSVDLHAHHDDYSKPLDVRWLCRRCHAKSHREYDV